MSIFELLIRLSPIGVFVAAIGGPLWWSCWFGNRQVARKKKAELLAEFLKDILEPELYKTLKNRPEGLAFYYLGDTPGPATTLYRVFEALGGVKALSSGRARWWQKTLERLASKLGFEMESVPGTPECERLIKFIRPQPLEEPEELE